MSKAPKESFYCLLCDWEMKDTHKHLDAIRCPECDGPVMTGEREKMLKQRRNKNDSGVL